MNKIKKLIRWGEMDDIIIDYAGCREMRVLICATAKRCRREL